MRISRTVAYAIQAMLHLARAAPGVPVPCRQLARAGGMPERFLLQILRSLVNHGLLSSTRGVEGGYSLTRGAHQTTLCEIVEAFDNSLNATAPMFDGFSAVIQERLLTSLQTASRLARNELQKVTVADLLRGEESDARPAAGIPPPHRNKSSSAT